MAVLTAFTPETAGLENHGFVYQTNINKPSSYLVISLHNALGKSLAWCNWEQDECMKFKRFTEGECRLRDDIGLH